jgi:hypothetical protein
LQHRGLPSQLSLEINARGIVQVSVMVSFEYNFVWEVGLPIQKVAKGANIVQIALAGNIPQVDQDVSLWKFSQILMASMSIAQYHKPYGIG